MQLRDFVAETIKEVIDGVVAAQAYAKKKGAVVNPKLNFHNYNQDLLLDSATGQPTRPISFDVGVTAAEGTKTQGGIAVFTGVLAWLKGPIRKKQRNSKSHPVFGACVFTDWRTSR